MATSSSARIAIGWWRRGACGSPVAWGLGYTLGINAERFVPQCGGILAIVADDLRPPAAACSIAAAEPARLDGPRAGRAARRHYPHGPQRRRPACVTSATRSTPTPVWPAAIGSPPAPTCRRCCSTTRRRWPWPSACAPPPTPASSASRRRRCGRSPSSSRCCPTGCAAGSSALQRRSSRCAGARRTPWSSRSRWPCSRRRAAITSRSGSTTPTRKATRRGGWSSRTSSSRWASAGTCVAWDVRRDDWRTFRVDRIAKPRLAGVRARPRELPAADAATYVSQSIGAGERRIETSVLLHAPFAEARAAVPERVGPLTEVGPHTHAAGGRGRRPRVAGAATGHDRPRLHRRAPRRAPPGRGARRSPDGGVGAQAGTKVSCSSNSPLSSTDTMALVGGSMP